MKKREYDVVTFTLSKHIRRVLKQYAKLKKKSMSEIVERALYEYFLRRRPTRRMLEQQ
jgi:predicted transcriptional regulator